jgi:hypothetical protein
MSLGSDFWKLFSPLAKWQKIIVLIFVVPLSVLLSGSFILAIAMLTKALAQIIMAVLR